MPLGILRNFLYLDLDIVEDYLSSIDGYLANSQQVSTSDADSKTGTGSIGFESIAKIGGTREARSGREIRTDGVITPAAKFQRLYDSLSDEEGIEYYDSFSPEAWDSLTRNEIVEATVEARFSKLSQMAELTQSLVELDDVMQAATGESMLGDAQGAIAGMNQLAKLEQQRGIPLIMTFPKTPGYTLVAYLDPAHMRLAKAMVGEVTILCRIQRKLDTREKLELVEPFRLPKQAMNRQQRRKLEKDPAPESIRDTVKAPAAVIVPVAIYR